MDQRGADGCVCRLLLPADSGNSCSCDRWPALAGMDFSDILMAWASAPGEREKESDGDD